MDASEESDDALAMRAGRGDRLAASRLIARHSPRVLAICLRMLGERASAEDAAQETFMKLWRSAGRWKPGRAKFETWLYRVASNACIDRLRQRRPAAPEDDALDIADEVPLADQGMIAAERSRAIETAVSALPDRQRLAIVLCYYQELSNADAASVMEVSVEALESLLARARKSLKESLAPARATLV